jgi:hypothetical protein
MRLTELNPRWCAVAGRNRQGVTFDCPHCRKARLCVFFANPVDGAEPLPPWRDDGVDGNVRDLFFEEHDLSPPGFEVVPPGFLWQRAGDTFETLTLSPSVDASASGHWHGFIRDGLIA